MNKKSKFIVLEGSEGAGKTSQLKLLKQKYGDKIVISREPGGSPFAEKIREIILCDEAKEANGKTLFALFWAARADHLANIIIPALENGKAVICDRFDSSTFAYQICAQGERELEDLFWQMRDFYLSKTAPDLYIYLQVDPEEGLRRKSIQENEVLNHFDKRKIDFHKKMQMGFEEFFSKENINSKIIDANKDFDTVNSELCKVIDKMLD